MTISQKLDSIDLIKSQIKQAIIDKEVPVSASDAFSTYPSKIGLISTSEDHVRREVSGDTFQVPSASFNYKTPSNAYNLGPRALNTSFYACSGVRQADLSSLRYVDGLYAAYKCFENCTNLLSIDLSNLVAVATVEETIEPSHEGVLNAPSRSRSQSDSVPSPSISNISAGSTGSLSYTCNGCTFLSLADLSNLQYVLSTEGMLGTFFGCIRLQSISLPELVALSGNYALDSAYQGCTGASSLSLPKLSSASGNYAMQNTFRGCTSLTSASFPKLTTIGSSALYYAFRGCTDLTSVTFPRLSTMYLGNSLRYAFYGCTSLTSVSFPHLNTQSFGTYTNQFNQMLYGCSNVTVHFPSNLQSVMGSWPDVVAGFGGTNTTVLFDLYPKVVLKIILNSSNTSTWLPRLETVDFFNSADWEEATYTKFNFIADSTTQASMLISVPTPEIYDNDVTLTLKCKDGYVLSETSSPGDSSTLTISRTFWSTDTTVNVYIDEPSSYLD